MSASQHPAIDDARRLSAVAATGLLDSDPEAAFDELAGLAARLLRTPFAFLTLVDQHRSFWKARVGVPVDGARQNSIEESFCQYVVGSAQPLIVGDVLADPLTSRNPSIESMGVRAWAGFPLTSPEGLVLGSFCVVDNQVRAWTDLDVEILRVLSAAASRELALRATVAAAAQAERRLTLLTEVGRRLAGESQIEKVVGDLAQLVVPLLGDWTIVSLVGRNGELTDVATWHHSEQLRAVVADFARDRLTDLDETGPTLTALRSGQPLVIGSARMPAVLPALKSPGAREYLRALAPSCYGIWPLVSARTVYGLLTVSRDEGRPAFSAEDQLLAEDIAERAGAVLANATMYSRQRSISAKLSDSNTRLRTAGRHDRGVALALQNAMLTRLPQLPDLRLAARYRAADSADEVGGDWYDAIRSPSGATTLVIGDVAGHDIEAATVMGHLRSSLRTLVWEHDDDSPSAIMQRLDRAMAGLELTTMTTLVVARIEPAPVDGEARVLRWSSAGHPAPVMLDRAGAVRLLVGAPDPPLATVRDAARHDHVEMIAPGQTLLMYTDGLVEVRDQDIAARQAHLIEVLGHAAGGEPERILDIAIAGMLGAQPGDDVATLAASPRARGR